MDVPYFKRFKASQGSVTMLNIVILMDRKDKLMYKGLDSLFVI